MVRAGTIARAAAWLALVALAAGPTVAEEAEGRERVWQGYLHRDGDGRILIGWPVVAMGVEVLPAHVVEGPLAEKLAPLVTEGVGSDHVFWNYSLEKEDGLAEVPRILVRLRGRVIERRESGASRGFLPGGSRRMVDARLEAVEFLSDAWLTTWARIFRLDGSPFVVRKPDDGLSPKERAAKLLPEVIAIVKEMRAQPGATEAQRKLVASIAPDARVVRRHRTSAERNLVRWLHRVNDEHGLDRDDLDDLGPLPPDSRDVARWFREAKSKAAFLERVREAWGGDLAEVSVAYYRVDGERTRLVTIDVARIAKEWSDERFRENRDASVKITHR